MTFTTVRPIVIIGSYRSGTTMLAGILRSLGLFTGFARDDHEEAIFFQRLNSWLLHSAGGSRSWPSQIGSLYSDPAACSATVEYLDFMVKSPRAGSFLGPYRYLRHRDIRRLSGAWGWKDPATTYTLPFWEDVFGPCKLIHVLRHPVDVVKSMTKLAENNVRTDLAQFRRWRLVTTVRPKRSGFCGLPRALTEGGAWEQWEEHVARAHQLVASRGSDAIEVRFEDILSAPIEVISRIADFCGLEPSNRSIVKAVAGIEGDRAFAYARSQHSLGLDSWRNASVERWGYARPEDSLPTVIRES